MRKEQARRLVTDTFQNRFEKARFVFFAKNLLNTIDESKAFHIRGNYIPEKYSPVVKSYERIGTYTDPEGKKVDVLAVYLLKEHTIERARTTLRNFVADYLKQRGEKDAALVAFVSPTGEEWRFSLVKMEYKLGETPTGRISAREEFTPARRYSFLVGRSEASHTAQSRLVPILEDDVHNPALENLEDAFSVEKATKEFFREYRRLFHDLQDELSRIVDRDPGVKKDFAEKNISTVDFAKKLLGQVVFLYFLQKKGWFGVKRGEEWGGGSKRFLRELFEKKHGEYKNFFNDILEPLFYEALRQERQDDYYSRFDCRIPFLNGGLFDPINDYDWIDTDIFLPNELFSNSARTKEGDTGNGILDVFDRYNFTVKEDEPLEKEVAVDPEMLGKVFENLLEVKDRKSKGTYYTPREIVHYMCEESLINYLATELEGKVSKDDIGTLVKYGETVVEHETRVESKGKETERYSYKLPESIRTHARLIDEKLANIRICDPAVGSGAFLVGMMSEIIRTRNALTPYLGADGDRTPYNFKRHAIQNCLYGVDIDPGAVEIAKLRLWLSLVVEEDLPAPRQRYYAYAIRCDDDSIYIGHTENMLKRWQEHKRGNVEWTRKHAPVEVVFCEEHDSREEAVNREKELKTGFGRKWLKRELNAGRLKCWSESTARQAGERERIQALPNLDYKIVCGNSLLGVEIDLFNQKLFAKLEELKPLFFNETNARKKQEYKNQIDELIKQITNDNENFDFQVYFSEVFHDLPARGAQAGKGGFDVVIGNPPYVRIQGMNESFVKKLKTFYRSSTGKFDIYVCFIEKGFSILAERGFLCFINPNKFLTASYGVGLRGFLKDNKALLQVIDFGDSQVFSTATNYTCILLLSKFPVEKVKYVGVYSSQDFDEFGFVRSTWKEIDQPQSASPWIFSSNGIGGILNRLKDVERLGEVCDEIFQGLISGADRILYLQFISLGGNTVSGRSLLNGNRYELDADICLNVLKGAEVKRWLPAKADLVAVYPYYEDVNRKTRLIPERKLSKEYPRTYSYLREFRESLETRGSERMEYESWYAYWCPRPFKKFKAPKILTQVLASRANYTIDECGQALFVGGGNAGVYGIIPKEGWNIKYILALLNSTLLDGILRSISTRFRGGYYSYAKRFIEKLPVAKVDKQRQKPFIDLVDKILAITKDEDYLESPEKQAKVRELEREIDQLVYKLYDLTDEEIKIVEGEAL